MSRVFRKIRALRLRLDPLEGRVVPAAIHLGATVVSALISPGIPPLVPSTVRLPVYLPHRRGIHGPVIPITRPVVSIVRVNGTVQGTFSEGMHNPIVGTQEVFQGSGTVHPFGKAQLTGSLFGGTDSGWVPGGLFELSIGRRSLLLSLNGRTQAAWTSLQSGTYEFTISGGPGFFAGTYSHGVYRGPELVGSGLANLTIGPGSFQLTFHAHKGPGL